MAEVLIFHHAQGPTAARHLDATLEEARLFAYPGGRHLFADDTLPAYDAGAAQQAEARVLELLDPLD